MLFGELIPLIGAILNGTLAIFVLLQNPRALVARVYCLLGLSLAVWNFGTFWMFRVTDESSALFWARFLQFGVIFIPITLCHISFLVAQVPISKRILQVFYAVHILLFLSNFTPFFLAGVRKVSYAWYSVAGTGFWILFGIFSLMWVSVGVLIWHRRRSPAAVRRRITPLIVAQLAITLFGCNDALPILGVDYYYPINDRQVYPFGSMAAIFYGMIVGYSVLQYQLLDVRVTLGSSAAKAVRMLFIFFAGLCALLVLWLVHPEGFSIYSFFAGLAALMLGAACAAVLFPKLFGETNEVIERRILGDTFEYQDQTRKFIDNMTWYNDMKPLLDDLHDLFLRVFRLDSYYIVVRDETSLVFEVLKSHSNQVDVQFPPLKTQSPVFQYFEWTKSEYLSLDANDVYTRTSPLAAQARKQLDGFKACFCFPLISNSDPFGLLLVGEKSGREQFTAAEISLLIALVKSLSLIVNQIRLKTQVLHSQELDLLGRMSRGMAHDLNNLLTPVWTLLQLSAETQTFEEELLPVALRNVKTMRAYIKEALFFSENLRPDLQLGRLDIVIQTAAELGRASRKKDVEVIAETAGETLVEMDEVLIQRLIANLISNAIDASPEGSRVRVRLERLVKGDTDRNWVRVQIIDQGEGIPRENLTRILKPYFTTKNRGDETRGFGLGLAICRKIVNLHGGNLSIASQPKKGTTVQFDLPSRQIQPAVPAVATSI
jgi:signal transduction histidine kinase